MNVVFIIVLLICFTSVAGQNNTGDCKVFELPENVSISEQDGKDTVVFNISYCGSTTWSMRVLSPSFVTDDYFAWDKIGGGYELMINETVNLEYFLVLYKKIIQEIVLEFSERSGPSNLTLKVSVTPVNEFSPRFLKTPFEINVMEETKVNTTIFSLEKRYEDKDALDHVTRIDTVPASIPGFDGSAYFHLVNQTIEVAAILDYESLDEFQKFFNLGLILYDTGDRTGTTEMTIKVIDVDEPPVFVKTECRRNGKLQYPWKQPGCLVQDYTVYVQPDGIVTTSPDINAIDYDIADNSITYSFPEDMEVFANTSCNLALGYVSGVISVVCNTSENATEDFDQFYQQNDAMDFNITVQASEVSPRSLNTTIPAVVHLGYSPVITTVTTKVTTPTTESENSTMTSTPKAAVTSPRHEPPNVTVTESDDDKTDTNRLLIIVVPSVIGGLILVLIVTIVICKVRAKTEDNAYKVRQRKLAQKQEYYAAYDNVGQKGDINGFSDVTTTTVVHDNELYDINTVTKSDPSSG